MRFLSGRFLAIHLPFLPTDRIRRRERREGAAREPLALWAKIGNAQCLTAVDQAAFSRGLRPDMPVVVARGMCPVLRLVEAEPEADEALLAAAADWSRRFTPLAALDAPDGIILDVSGVAHLFGGEEGLLHPSKRRFSRKGLRAASRSRHRPPPRRLSHDSADRVS